MAAIKERIYQSLMDLKDEHEKKPGKQTKCEGQLILKYPFGVFKSPKIPTKCYARFHSLKVRRSRNDFFQTHISSKTRTNEFNFTTIIPQVDLFSFVF